MAQALDNNTYTFPTVYNADNDKDNDEDITSRSARIECIIIWTPNLWTPTLAV